jgi:transcriptional regulator with XRE-family HTH domain
MSAYFGGRSEVHLRREIVQVLHCDFLSMYPTVCTLMGLWRFVISQGITFKDDTNSVRKFIKSVTLSDLQCADTWKRLNVLVQVLPQDDIFPVRARYPTGSSVENDDATATIGLNRLTRNKPLWFTLADCLVSKILTGNSSRIVRAIRFTPQQIQNDLKSISIAGNQAYRIDPTTDDFYKRLIELRQDAKARSKTATPAEKATLKSDRQSIKILANATSYGIFVELNVEDLDKPERMICNGWKDKSWEVTSKKFEKPGRYFHPLLGTLITGAARLMLALAEREALNQGLNWVFCDTDSIAIAKPDNLDESIFIKRALSVCDWFKPLNPYDNPNSEKNSILQVEDVNFRLGCEGDLNALEPLYCFAVSAKRYALFNRTTDGNISIRKASAHGLGHLLAPYEDPDRDNRLEHIGVELWQEDVWREIIKSAIDGHPDQVSFEHLPGFDHPAASRFAATTPNGLGWFRGYNASHPEAERVHPFNFLLSLHAKSVVQSAAEDPQKAAGRRSKRREPRPAAPYDKEVLRAVAKAFDRDTGQPVPPEWLISLGRSLVRYHIHPETKFWGADYDERGQLSRRHIFAETIQPIGKEADKLEERETIGDDDAEIEYDLSPEDRAKLISVIKLAKKDYGLRQLSLEAKISHHRINDLIRGIPIPDRVLIALSNSAHSLRRRDAEQKTKQAALLRWLRKHLADENRNSIAQSLGMDPSNLSKVLKGRRRLSAAQLFKLDEIYRYLM